MAKSNRRRKLDRAKRQARDSRKQAAAQRRQEAEEAIEAALADYYRIMDPATSVADLAGLLNDRYDGDPVSISLVNGMVGSGSSVERLAETAEVVLASAEADGRSLSITALTFAAEVARVSGDKSRAAELLDQALAATDDWPVRVDLARHLRASGRLADGIEMLETRLRDTPGDDNAAELYGLAVQDAYLRVGGQEQVERCSCGRDAFWPDCCGPREMAALKRFSDRSGLIALSDAVSAFLVSSGERRALDREVAEFLGAYDDLEWESGELAAFRELLEEHALLTARRSPVCSAEEDPSEEDAPAPLAAFAADPSAPTELAARADVWREYVRYGLWRIDSSSSAPGLDCMDLCSGEVRYADFPAGVTSNWPRWSVWLGGIVPVDGVWRATGRGLRLSPAEADAAAELVEEATTSVVHALAGKKAKPSRSPAEPLRIGEAEPIGVYVDWQEPASPGITKLLGKVLGSLLPRIVGDVHVHRSAPFAMRAASEGWDKHWLDEQVPALNGLTPRQAATGKERPRLEGLLRQFEFEADVLAEEGRSGIDTAWLREELDLADGLES